MCNNRSAFEMILDIIIPIVILLLALYGQL